MAENPSKGCLIFDNWLEKDKKRNSRWRAMAPRIRLNIAKPLPTISEAREDILEDTLRNTKTFEKVNVNPESSGEDYLQSICQLAKPTFPVLPESQQKIQDIDKAEMLHKSHRVSETPKPVTKYKVTNTFLSVLSLERNILHHVKSYSRSREDPLEELYTDTQKTRYWRCPNSNEDIVSDSSQHSCHATSLYKSQEKNTGKKDTVSFPRLPSPRPSQRGNSCPELKRVQTQGKMPILEHVSYQKENDPLVINGKPIWLCPSQENQMDANILRCSQREHQALNTGAGPEKEQLKSFIHNQTIKKEASSRKGSTGFFHNSQKAVTCRWISEYQCAWKEAKVRACLLPAILES
ncbi:uncharacterized protein LOC125429655 isoform X1 [Sphaerodactylus townsendi]|uniref:uncharacterized protein LOC125429655 isoform X1 n=2 Tax=Sphaerodactylus townsendi TaxID=933632 RepID=UPI002025D46B|nr:uncharacterized protein LOC125429655 isoform X1 [Sphaerodactylus townsendi]